jgi:hypothetical protein
MPVDTLNASLKKQEQGRTVFKTRSIRKNRNTSLDAAAKNKMACSKHEEVVSGMME